MLHECASFKSSVCELGRKWPGSMLTYGEWRLSYRLCFLIIPSSGYPTSPPRSLLLRSRSVHQKRIQNTFEVVASHRCRCCKKMDLRLALFCEPPRSESVPTHYPFSPVVQHDRSPTSECGELRVTPRIPTPKKAPHLRLLSTFLKCSNI